VTLIEPHYPSGRRGRPPIGVERMLRIYFLQQWYTLADEADSTPPLVKGRLSEQFHIRNWNNS
jgi:hypothetical protein